MAIRSRGRDDPFGSPGPTQIPASGSTALGLTSGNHAQSLLLPAVSVHSAQVLGFDVGAVSWLCPRFPAWCPFRVLHIDSSPGSVSGTCFARTNSLWPGRLAPPSPPTAAHRRLCSSASQLLSACPTSRLRASLSCSFRIHSADLGAIPLGSEAGSPGSRVSNFRTCTGSRDHAGAESFSRPSERFHVAFRSYDYVGPPKSFSFRGSIPGPHVPLSMLRLHSYEYTRMTRGQHGSLLLSL